jgi:hypothetical protein
MHERVVQCYPVKLKSAFFNDYTVASTKVESEYDRHTLSDSSVFATNRVLLSMYMSMLSQTLMIVFLQLWQL